MDSNAQNKWWIVFAMGCTLGIILLDETVVALALPAIEMSLKTSSFVTHWIINAYLLTLTCFVAVCGKLGDVLGRKKWFILGASLFALGAAGAGAALAGPWIIAARAVQGLGAAILFPTAIAIVTLVFPPNKRGLAIGIFGSIGTAFVPISAAFGGLLATLFSWRFVFWMTLPALLGIASIVHVFFEEEPEETNGTLKDFRGLLTLILGLTLLILALMQSHHTSWHSPYLLTMLFAALVILGIFFVIEAKNNNPLIDVTLFKRSSFSAATLVIFTAQYTKLCIIVFGALYLQKMLKMTPFEAGLALFPGMLFYPLVTTLAGWLTDRFGSRKLLLISLFVIAVALLWFALFVNHYNYSLLLPAILIWGIATPFLFVPSVTEIMGSVSEKKRGQAGGIALTAQILGGAISIAVLGVYVADTPQFSRLFYTAFATTALVWIIVWALMNHKKATK